MTAPDPQSLPRLLEGVGQRPIGQLSEHLAVHGQLGDLRRRSGEELMTLVERSGLRGHGGAAFPTATKMRAVASRRGQKVLVANGTEGEPASKKDRTLLRQAPHLVLDGAAVAARAVGALRAIIAVSEADVRTLASLAEALAERRASGAHVSDPKWQVVATAPRYLAGQESALVDFLSGGPGLPTFGPRPFERGVRGRPTLVQNVETLAHLALIARHGAGWFRALGTDHHPGSALVTVCGVVDRPGVYEIAHGMALSDLLAAAGSQPTSGILIGGYFGTWLPGAAAGELPLTGEGLRAHGASLGAGVIGALGTACPVAETARVAGFFAAESAGQCGPCVHGLSTIADTLSAIAAGTGRRPDLGNLTRWATDVSGRGACQHPDGSVRFVASALRVFEPEFEWHVRHGRCERCAQPPVLPVPASPALTTAAASLR